MTAARASPLGWHERLLHTAKHVSCRRHTCLDIWLRTVAALVTGGVELRSAAEDAFCLTE